MARFFFAALHTGEDWCVLIHYLSVIEPSILFIYLFGVLRHFQHCTGHIMTGSWRGIPAFPLEAMPGTEPWPQRWEARVLPLCHRGPLVCH